MLKELVADNQDTGVEAMFICDKGFLEQARGIMSELPFTVKMTTVPSGKLRRYAHFSWWHYIRHFSIVLLNVADTGKTIAGFFKSIWIIARFRPDVVFAKGGFVCLPVGYAARLLRVPLVIHDSDARPGLTNRLLARFAQSIGTGMPVENYGYDAARTVQVGVPISSDISPATPTMQRAYRDELGLPKNKQLIVGVGGGLGSIAINTGMMNAARHFEQDKVLFYNVTGISNDDQVRVESKDIAAYQHVPFVYKDMYKLLAAADIVVTRASATTLQELAGLQKTVIAVPAKQLGDQQKNAELFASYKAVSVLQDDELQDKLVSTLQGLLSDDARRSRMAHNLHAFARPHAARDMAQLIREAAG